MVCLRPWRGIEVESDDGGWYDKPEESCQALKVWTEWGLSWVSEGWYDPCWD